MCRGMIVLACVLAGAPLRVSAQQQDTVPQDTVSHDLWRRAARSNWHIRLIVPVSDTIGGRVRYSSGQARMDGEPVPQVILRVERRMVRGNGALVGGLIGLVVGGFMGAGVAQGLSEGDAGSGLEGFGVGGGLGGMLGVLSGHIAAPGRVEWEPVWIRPGPDR